MLHLGGLRPLDLNQILQRLIDESTHDIDLVDLDRNMGTANP